MHRLVAFAFALTLLITTSLAAQTSSAAVANAQTTSSSRGAPDFLFGPPHGSLGLRGSWMFASAGSDLFDFVQQHLTVEKKDFNAPVFGFDVGLVITPRIDLVFGFDGSRAGTSSEYRAFVDNRQLPINQETTLKERNVFGSVRFNLVPRGRSVGRFAYVPRMLTPYVGAGGGALWYQFEQSGDFVDFADSSVFTDYFSSGGFTPSMHVFGGTDLHLYRVLFLTFEGKYVWANAKLGQDFIDFDPIDLGGFRVSTGINVLF
jgi:hypothetical protein